MAKRGVAVDVNLPVASMSRSTLTELTVAEIVGTYGYRPASVSVDRLAFARSFRPTWATVLAIVFGITGIGLFLLLIRSTETFSVSIREDHSGMSARIHGRVHPVLLGRLEALVRSRPNAPAQRMAVPSNSLFNAAATPPVATPAQHFQPPPQYPAGPAVAQHSAPPPSPPPASPAPYAPPPLPDVQPLQVAGSPFPPAAPAAQPASPWLLATPAPQGPVALPDEHTRAAARPPAPPVAAAQPGAIPVLRFEDGRRVPVTSFILLGRNPERGTDDPTAQLVVVDDQTVSKTHVALGVDAAGLWLVDRHSTNGTAVVSGNGEVSPVAPGTAVRVAIGSWVRVGTRTVLVEAAS